MLFGRFTVDKDGHRRHRQLPRGIGYIIRLYAVGDIIKAYCIADQLEQLHRLLLPLFKGLEFQQAVAFGQLGLTEALSPLRAGYDAPSAPQAAEVFFKGGHVLQRREQAYLPRRALEYAVILLYEALYSVLHVVFFKAVKKSDLFADQVTLHKREQRNTRS